MLFVPDEIRKRLDAERFSPALPTDAVLDLVRGAGLRPTRQRLSLGRLLFRQGHRHVTADDLHHDVIEAGVPLSLATVYNTLNQFADAGLVRRVSVNGERTYFDTDIGDHNHFYVEAEDRIIDIPAGEIQFGQLPEPPTGYEIARTDVVIRLKRIEVRTASGCHGSKPPACKNCGKCAGLVPERTDHTAVPDVRPSMNGEWIYDDTP